MLGIIAKKNESEVVKEFFQLFKVPWEFCIKEKEYDIVITTEQNIREVKSKLYIIYSSKELKYTNKNEKIETGKYKKTILNLDKFKLPIYGNVLLFKAGKESLLNEHKTQMSLGFQYYCLQSKIIRVGYDLYDEVMFLLTKGQPIKNAHIPTLDYHIEILRRLIIYTGYKLLEVYPVPYGYSFIVCLTHDVDFIKLRHHLFDHTMAGYLYRSTIGSVLNFYRKKITLKKLIINIKSALLSPLVYLGYIEDYWMQFDNYLKIECGLVSTYFIVPFKDTPGEYVKLPNSKRRAIKYNINEIKTNIKKIISNGNEVGTHGIDAWNNYNKGNKEKDEIDNKLGMYSKGVRVHWLIFDKYTPLMLEKAGFIYDSTFGYNETIGFRAGTSQAYKHIISKKILEIPLNIQDVSMFSQAFLNLSEKEAWKRCDVMIQHLLQSGGVLTVLWHMRSLGPERLWNDFYIQLVNYLKEKSVWFATMSQATEWYNIRRSLIFEKYAFTESKIDICIKSTQRAWPFSFLIKVYNTSENKHSILCEPLLYQKYVCSNTGHHSIYIK